MGDEEKGAAPPGRGARGVIPLWGAGAPGQAYETPPGRPATEGQWAALRQLADKQAGGDVPWINIADARALTDAGLAQRSREGWDITAAGLAALDGERRRGAESASAASDTGPHEG